MNIRTRLMTFPLLKTAIVYQNTRFTYNNLLQMMDIVEKEKIKPGGLVTIVGETSIVNIARLFAAIDANAIAVPMATIQPAKLWQVESKHYKTIRKRLVPGLVLFTSGSTGSPKAALHDMSKLMERWKIHNPQGWYAAKDQTIMSFLGFDHIGGINTLFHTLFNGGTLVIPNSRNADEVATCIDNHRVQVLPTSPTFLKMLLMKSDSEFKGLEMITYGTEPMPESTLAAVAKRWPHVKLKQTYGLTELGILSTKSKGDGSTWMKIGGDGYKYRVVDDCLEIKAESTMIGYLTSNSPITLDGYYQTGDMAEQDGEGWIRIIGRKSEFINVGGNKVHPAEIESILSELPSIEECLVESEDNPILGQVVKATIKLGEGWDLTITSLRDAIKAKFDAHTNGDKWKIPQKIIITDQPLHNERFKKVRHV